MKIIESLKLSWLTWVWKHTPNCAEMARLSSQRLDAPLPLGTRLKMRLHLLICAWCHRYLKQLELMHEHLHHADEHAAASAKRGLSLEARQRIVRHLHEADGREAQG